MKPRFTMDDMIRANEEWGANCGPGAIAAIMGMTLDGGGEDERSLGCHSRP